MIGLAVSILSYCLTGAFCLTGVFCLTEASAAEAPKGTSASAQGMIVFADEVHIEQETGRYKKNKPAVPLGGGTNPKPEGAIGTTPAGATNPNTCDPKNATSPSCYTATQQGHK